MASPIVSLLQRHPIFLAKPWNHPDFSPSDTTSNSLENPASLACETSPKICTPPQPLPQVRAPHKVAVMAPARLHPQETAGASRPSAQAATRRGRDCTGVTPGGGVTGAV